MNHHLPKEQDLGIDLESGIPTTRCLEDENPNLDPPENPSRSNLSKLYDRFATLDDNLASFGANPFEDSPENNVNKAQIDTKVDVERFGDFDFTGKKKSKNGYSSAKKPPKPPRPPRGFSLDAYDHKLIRELAEIAMIKRARIERMKALKVKKSLKTSSSSSSSNGSLFAMIFTTIFFLVILFQGMSCRKTGATFQGSPQTAQINENGLIFIQEQLNPSASDSVLPDSKLSNLHRKISGSNYATK